MTKTDLPGATEWPKAISSDPLHKNPEAHFSLILTRPKMAATAIIFTFGPFLTSRGLCRRQESQSNASVPRPQMPPLLALGKT